MHRSTLSVYKLDWSVRQETNSFEIYNLNLVLKLTVASSLDDMIIVQLGTLNYGRKPDEKKRWVDGLRAVLKDLRQLPNIREPDVGAAAVAKYRREFFQDPSRILDY